MDQDYPSGLSPVFGWAVKVMAGDLLVLATLSLGTS